MHVVRAVAHVVAGTCWLIADFVTWRTHGTLASSSLVDVVRLQRAHEAHISGPDIAAIAALPLLGSALAACSAWQSRAAGWIRVALALAGIGVSVGLLIGLGNGSGASLGPGAWLVITGSAGAGFGAAGDLIAVAVRRRALKSAS